MVPGIDGSGEGAQYAAFFDHAASVQAVLAFVTTDGSAAAKTYLEPTTDYVVASDGRLEIVTDQSANTLIVVYRRL